MKLLPKNIFRWSYLLPRLMILALLLVFSEQGVAWLVKYAVESAGQSSVGARVEIASAEASLLGSRVELLGLQIANPEEPMTNLLEADRITLDFETDSLLRKHAIVSRGVLSGLRFGTDRITSGELSESELEELDDEAAGMPAWLTDAASDRAKGWLDDLGDRFSTDIENKFESVRLARELRDKWPAEYDRLTAAAEQVRTEAESLRKQVKEARRNPLRHTQFLQSVPSRLQTLDAQLRQLYAELDALPGQIEADRRRIAAAREHDERLVRESLATDAIDSQALTAYLLGEEVAGPMKELIGWLRWARRMAPSKPKIEDDGADRGEDILFAGIRQRPDVLIRLLELDGTARIAGRPVDITGQVTDFTTDPTLHGEPVRLILNTTGSMPMKLRATIDRTGDVARDEVLADCQGILIPRLKLGGGKWLGLSIEPSRASLSVSLHLDGEKLSGDVQLIQQQVRMTPRVEASGALPTAALHSALETNFRRLPQIATRVNLSGTLDEPEMGVWSNLGPAVAQAMESAVEQTARAHADRMLAASRAEVDSQLAQFDGELRAAMSRLGPALDGPRDLLKQVAAELTGGSPFAQIGQKAEGLTGLLK